LNVFIYTAYAKKVELEYLADLRPCARCLIFKLHFSYLLNRNLYRGFLHDGRWDDFWCVGISHQAKQKFKCLLTQLKYCREHLVVQEDYLLLLLEQPFVYSYNLSLENNVFLLNCALWLISIHRIILPHISPWQSGIV
jgi:hypothetical protein